MPRTSEILDLAALNQLEALQWTIDLPTVADQRFVSDAVGDVVAEVSGSDTGTARPAGQAAAYVSGVLNAAPALIALARAGLATKSDLLSTLARERRRRAALEEVLRQIRRMAAFGEEGYDTPETLSRIVALTDTHPPRSS